MSRQKRGPQWLNTHLVDAPVYLGICTTEPQYVLQCKKFKVEPGNWINPNADATLHTFSRPGKQDVCIICIRPRGKRSRAAYAALLVHEAAHVWQRIRDELGDSNPSSEFEAYSMQSLCQRLFEAVGL